MFLTDCFFDPSSLLNHINITLVRFNLKHELDNKLSSEFLKLTRCVEFNDNVKNSPLPI